MARKGTINNSIITKKCKYCEKVFKDIKHATYLNHLRWCDKNPSKIIFRKKKCKYCSEDFYSVGIKVHERKCYLNPENKKYCKNCGKLIKNNKQRYCNRKCSNSHEENKRYGKDHPNWKLEKTEYQHICYKNHKKECIICGFKYFLEVHHVDENHQNSDPENLVPLCKNHHYLIHSRYKNKIKKYIVEYVENRGRMFQEGEDPLQGS